MAGVRAPKQWPLTKTESITTFENWKQNLIYTLSLDQNFAPFMEEGVTWEKKSPSSPTRGLRNDPSSIPKGQRKTAQQKVVMLELLLGQIANYAPVISRNSIVNNSTSLKCIWRLLRLHFGFQKTGAHFLEFDNIAQDPEERPEDLYQRLLAFIEDNLLTASDGISHHGEVPANEVLSPTTENLIVLTWLRLLHPGLPKLVKQRFSTELRSRTIASIKPEISLALDSLLDEVRQLYDVKIQRSFPLNDKRQNTRSYRKAYPTQQATQKQHPMITNRQCPLCIASGRTNISHFLSNCKFLPESDRQYMTKARQIFGPEEIQENPEGEQDDVDSVNEDHHVSRVNVKRSPTMKVHYRHYPLNITLDTGAETNMMKVSTAKYINAEITKSTQTAVQADGTTPLTILGEVHITVSRNGHDMKLDALVVEDMDSDVLAGTPFMEENDVAVRPALKEICIQGKDSFSYDSTRLNRTSTVRRAQVLRGHSNTTTVYPGEYIECQLPNEFYDCEVAVEPRSFAKTTHQPTNWLKPSFTETVASRVRLNNDSNDLVVISKHDHFGQVLLVNETTIPESNTSTPEIKFISHQNYSAQVHVDPDGILSEEMRQKFLQVLKQYDSVFDPQITGYNGAVGPFKSIVNMGPTQPPQRKGRIPQYNKDKLQELQAKFDELESLGVVCRPEDAGVTVEYLNPSFLVKKASGGYRLVTAFADVGRYCKPSPSLMTDVDSTLRSIASWEYLITTDLTSAFYQIPLAKDSMKYCGIVTPFRGIRVYTRSAMGMPGSETALEELTYRVLGDLLQEGCIAKLADDLYCGGSTPDELLQNWRKVLDALCKCNLKLSPTKTTICPRSTTVLGWIWSSGSIHASPHRISTLSTCMKPKTVQGLRSFIGAYKAISRVLPGCAQYLAPLDNLTAGNKSNDTITWSENSEEAFHKAQEALKNNQEIVLPTTSEQLWIVTDGSVKNHGIGATLYAVRNGKVAVAGFYSAKFRKHQVTWLPCEVEALGIASAIKHFAPYIIQSDKQVCLLTDSKPCVQAFEKMCRGEFSASPRVTSFLSTVSRYQIIIRHLAGSANIPSDFASRNAPECIEPRCQICTFINTIEDSVVRKIAVQDIIDGSARIPYSTRSTWIATQLECPDLRRVHAHLKQGTRPSKKITNIRDVKRYLNSVVIAKDGLLVVHRAHKILPNQEVIVVPRQAIVGLTTALHIKLAHPTRHQLKCVMTRTFYALDMESVIDEVTSKCHTCAALQKLPEAVCSQSSDDPPNTIGVSFAADVIKRHRQLILILRETVTSYTVTSLIDNERHETLRDTLVEMCSQLRPYEGSTAVIRVDPAPGFVALSRDKVLQQSRMKLEIGRVKNKNKNPVAEKAVSELIDELLRLEPGIQQISRVQLCIATARLNSRIRSRGLSAREMMFLRNQFTNDPLPVSDRDLIDTQRTQRMENHPSSEKSKYSGRNLKICDAQVGDLVYLYCDKDKLQARDRYLVISVDDPWCLIRKFTDSQLRSAPYKIKLSECYKVPSNDHSDFNKVNDKDVTLPCTKLPDIPNILSDPTQVNDDVSKSVQYHIDNDAQDKGTCDRPRRTRKPPSYLDDYVP